MPFYYILSNYPKENYNLINQKNKNDYLQLLNIFKVNMIFIYSFLL